MTDDSKIFYSKIKDMLVCSNCQEMMIDPVDCNNKNCNNTICRICWNDKCANQCSTCKTESECSTNSNLLKLIELLRFKCINNDIGCNVESKITDYLGHITDC